MNKAVDADLKSKTYEQLKFDGYGTGWQRIQMDLDELSFVLSLARTLERGETFS